ncbi:MAG: hypothetical protein HC899_15310 [Leptolyngbyaceae cyanobacterium SM1_4_3]|nr:hypothetical protein [Leptolyngbyaceae cyanobacterium SM1_4_3]
MRPDLQGLEITRGELRKLSGVDTSQMFRRSVMRDAQKRSHFLIRQTLEISLLTLLGFLPFAFAFNQFSPELQPIRQEYMIFGSAATIALSVATVIQAIRVKKSTTSPLVGLLDEVDRHNAMIRAIDINDQIEAAGNLRVRLSNRYKVIEALKITRANLVRALKTERILRENKRFIDRNPELFADSLMALRALQVSDQASEHGRLLNEALEIGLSVQDEMRKLQSRP